MFDDNSRSGISMGLKIAASYLVVTGIIEIIWIVFDIGSLAWSIFNLPPNPWHAEFAARSAPYRVTVYTRTIIIDILMLIAGIGVFLNKPWARKMGLVLMVIISFYFTRNFARGLAGGRLSALVLFVSAVISCVWHGIFFYLLLDRGKRKAMGRRLIGTSFNNSIEK
jgi:hypothetical protein